MHGCLCEATAGSGTVFNMQDIWRFYDAPYGFGVPIVLEGEDCEVLTDTEDLPHV